MRKMTAAAVLGLLLWVSPAFAAAPNILTYQGRLIQSGVPASGPQMVEIHLCPDVATPLGSCFSTTNQGVNAASGLFRTTFTIPSAVNLASGVWWLNVSVNSTPLSPREQLTSSPFAAFASTASSLGSFGGAGVFVSTNIGINIPQPQAALHVGASYLGQAMLLLDTSVTGDSPGIKLRPSGPATGSFIEMHKTGAGATSRLDFVEAGAVKWQLAHQNSALQNRLDVMNPAWSASPQMAFATDGTVGVGTNSPFARLHVATSAANSFDMVFAVSTDTFISPTLRVMGTGLVAASSNVTVGGNLGIGLPNPSRNLHIQTDGGQSTADFFTYDTPAGARSFLGLSRSRGSVGTPLFPTSADSLGELGFGGLGNPGGMGTIGASIRGSAAQTWGVGSQGTMLTFFTTPNGATGLVPRMVIVSTGAVGIGTTMPNSMLQVVGGSTTVSALQVNNGGHIHTTGPVPTLGAGCGTGNSIVGTDVAGRITLGSAAVGTCTLTFASPYAGSVPVCIVNNLTSGAAGAATTGGATFTLVPFGGSLTLLDVWSYVCIGL